MHEPQPTLDAAIARFVLHVRAELGRRPPGWRIALFVHDHLGWRPIVIDPGFESDLDGELIWAANRMARLLSAGAAAYVGRGHDDAPIVSVERRGAESLEVHALGNGAVTLQPSPFEIVPGGTRGEGWGALEGENLRYGVSDSMP